MNRHQNNSKSKNNEENIEFMSRSSVATLEQTIIERTVYVFQTIRTN